jgi:predicted DNA-binding transcriptional regulator AlpA
MKKEAIVKREIKPRMFSIDEAAHYIGLAAKTIRNRIGPKAGNPFPVKPKHIGGRVLFDLKDLDTYLDRLPTT